MTKNSQLVSSCDEIRTEVSRFLKGPKANLLFPHVNLKDDLCLDSLDIVELIVHLEKKFGVEFDGDTMPSVETVGDMARYTQSLVTENVKI
ncbi:MAG: acyl carrier protein [Deltaproteobacteria bacterium]|nr:acyl carrier protein [Deltaproteobacteria bacterium]